MRLGLPKIKLPNPGNAVATTLKRSLGLSVGEGATNLSMDHLLRKYLKIKGAGTTNRP